MSTPVPPSPSPPSRAPPLPPAAVADAQSRWRRHLRWVAVRATLGAGVLVLLLGLGLLWLMNSIGGRDLLLRQIVARLPADATLTWQRAQGPASGPLVLHGLRFRWKGTTLVADTVLLDPAVGPLLSGKLRLDALHVQGAVLSIPRSAEPFKLPAWPDSLPAIEPPLPLHAEKLDIRRLRVDYDGTPVLAVSRLLAGVDVVPGALHVEHLVMDSDRGRFTLHGDYRPLRDARTTLHAGWHVPARGGHAGARLGLAMRGRVAAMQVALVGRAPGPVDLRLSLHGREHPAWQLRAHADGVDEALFAGSADTVVPLDADLRMEGRGGGATLEGTVRHAGERIVVRPSRVQLGRQQLGLRPLVLDVLGGRIAAVGAVDFSDPAKTRLDANLAARGLAWAGGAAAKASERVVADADIALHGSSQGWDAAGTARLARDRQVARLELDVHGTGSDARIKRLRATMPTGTLDATGTVAWSPGLRWDVAATLAGFDPQYFVTGWPGAIRGDVATRGARPPGGALEAQVDVNDLGGTLRGRALAGGGHLAITTPAGAGATSSYRGDADLRIGASHVVARGTLGDALVLDAEASPLQLADLWPDAAGMLRGNVHLRGRRDAPDVAVDVEGSALRWGAWQAARLAAHGHLPWTQRAGTGALHLQASGVQAGTTFDTLALDARGAMDSLALDAHGTGALGDMRLQANGAHAGDAWTGRLAALAWTPHAGPGWRLRAPATLVWSPRATTLRDACLDSSAGGHVCAQADWPRQARLQGDGLPLSLVEPWLPARDDGRPWRIRGTVAVDATVTPAGASWRGVARVRSPDGGIAIGPRPNRASRPRAAVDELLRYDALAIDGSFGPAGYDATLGAGFAGHGRVDATLAGGWDAKAAWRGTAEIETSDVTWLELLSPDLVAPTGRLSGRLDIGGTRAVPRLSGDARLAAFGAELPALGLTLRDGAARLDALADGNARLHGQVRSGDGVLTVDGTLGWGAGAPPLRLRVAGTQVLASDTRELRAVVDPALDVTLANGDAAVTVTGAVTVTSARIDLERLDHGAQASPDVVVLDPADPAGRAALGLDLDLALVAGKDVRLKGFGLDGRLAGKLQVRARPGREVLASGELDVDGSYTAYGSKLAITRGALRWNNGPVGDPLLDVRAERDVGDVTAGVDVRGRASAPIASVWTDPASSPSEAIAYLALGRPLASASREEGQRVNAARSALSIGGNLLVSQLGARIGLDDAGVSASRALGSEVIGAGKYLSPRLYVGYGVALVGSGSVLTLKYLLRKGFDIEIESSTVENRASVNWRKER